MEALSGYLTDKNSSLACSAYALYRKAQAEDYSARQGERWWLRLHQLNTARFASQISRTIFSLCPDAELPAPDMITLGMLVHDIGKHYLPDPSAIDFVASSYEETQAIKLALREHVRLGAAKANGMPEELTSIIRFHHERPGGQGYPYGITDIPMHVQIAKLTDYYDAVTGCRPYRTGQLDEHRAKQQISGLAGIDSRIMQAFLCTELERHRI